MIRLFFIFIFIGTSVFSNEKEKYQYGMSGVGVNINRYQATYSYNDTTITSTSVSTNPYFLTSSLIEINDDFSFSISTGSDFFGWRTEDNIDFNGINYSNEIIVIRTDVGIDVEQRLSEKSFLQYGLLYNYETIKRYELVLSDLIGDIEEQYGFVNVNVGYHFHNRNRAGVRGIHYIINSGVSIPFFKIFSGSVPKLDNVDVGFVYGASPFTNLYWGYSFIKAIEVGVFSDFRYTYRVQTARRSDITIENIDIVNNIVSYRAGLTVAWNFY